MREERGTLAGDMIIHEPFTLWGSIGGDVRVIQGGKFYLRGAIYGNLTVEYGGRVHILGNLSGNLVLQEGTKVIVSGAIAKDALNEGGRLYIDESAKVMGDVKTRAGKTDDKRRAKAT
jgi:predicted acyltransferase (DUF342 family)